MQRLAAVSLTNECVIAAAGKAHARTNFAGEFQTAGRIHNVVSITRKSRSDEGGCERLQLQGDCETRTREGKNGREEGTTRARARATRRGYNPRARHILHVRKCWQALQASLQGRDCPGKRRKNLEYAPLRQEAGLRVLNVVGVKTRAHSGMNDLIATLLQHA